MGNENQEQATPPESGSKKEKSGIIGRVICIVGVLLVVLGIIGEFAADEDAGVGGGGGGAETGDNWQYRGKDFRDVFSGFSKDEGMVYKYKHDAWRNAINVMQAMKKGNLVECEDSNRLIWVETQRRYEDDEPLDEGFYIRRGWMEYETRLGAEKRVPRYVEVTGNLLAKVKKQIADEKAAEEAKAKAKARIAAILQVGKTAGETKTITLPGGVAMEMVWCPSGRFRMGGDHSEYHVTLTKGFWMGKTEVTQAQWKSVMGNNPSNFKGDDLPVECVSWDDCQKFYEETGLQLPTEAQWEYACRAGNTGLYSGSGNLDDMGWYADNSGGKTHPVRTKHPNAWGLYDMHGNVWEWCWDWAENYLSGEVTDPHGPFMHFGSSGRVARGGSWDNDASNCTSSCRGEGDPSSTYSSIGFRLVKNLSE